jgi:hypothetical protein
MHVCFVHNPTALVSVGRLYTRGQFVNKEGGLAAKPASHLWFRLERRAFVFRSP